MLSRKEFTEKYDPKYKEFLPLTIKVSNGKFIEIGWSSKRNDVEVGHVFYSPKVRIYNMQTGEVTEEQTDIDFTLRWISDKPNDNNFYFGYCTPNL